MLETKNKKKPLEMKRRSAVLSLLISPPKLKMMALLSCRTHGAEDLHQEIQAEKVQAG